MLNKQEVDFEINKLQIEKAILEERIIELKKRKLEFQYGFKDGEECLYNGKKAIVRLLNNQYWFTVALMKKDGDYSSTIRYVYNSDELSKRTN